jgi:hypothetical protein
VDVHIPRDADVFVIGDAGRSLGFAASLCGKVRVMRLLKHSTILQRTACTIFHKPSAVVSFGLPDSLSILVREHAKVADDRANPVSLLPPYKRTFHIQGRAVSCVTIYESRPPVQILIEPRLLYLITLIWARCCLFAHEFALFTLFHLYRLVCLA